MDEVNKSAKRFVIIIAMVGGMAGLLYGVDFGVINGSLQLMKVEWNLTIAQEQIITSSLLLGALFGTIACGFFVKQFGRKRALVLAGAIFTIGSVVASLSFNYQMMSVMRFVLGFGVGFASFASPLYLSEIAPAKSRGFIISIYLLMITIGIFVVFVNNAIISYFLQSWRIMILSVAVPAAAMWVGISFLPKTPRWLIMKGRKEEALSVMKRIRETQKEIDFELKEINEVLEQQGKKKEKIINIIKRKEFIAILLVGMGLQLCKQFDGLNTFMYYSNQIYAHVGFAHMGSTFLTVLIGFINLVSTVIAMIFMDRWGRKPLLYLGVASMVVSMAGMALIFCMNPNMNYTNIEKYIFATLSFVFIFMRAISTAPISWIICSEVFPLKCKEFGMTITTITNWVGSFLIGRFSLTAFELLGYSGTFLTFGIILFIGLIFIWRYVPETKGIPLEEIEENLMDGVPLRKLGTRRVKVV